MSHILTIVGAANGFGTECAVAAANVEEPKVEVCSESMELVGDADFASTERLSGNELESTIMTAVSPDFVTGTPSQVA